MRKTVFLILIMVFLAGILSLKQGESGQYDSKKTIADANLPAMLELGSDKCMACKMMEPVLEELRESYDDKFRVEFHDVWKNTNIAIKYQLESIPTQIFLDKDGNELFRHIGFYSTDEIISQWNKLGFAIEQGGSKAWLMQDIYLSVTSGIKSNYIMVALLAAFAWGILSLLLSPCHLTSIPLIIAYVNGQGIMTRKRAFNISAMFSLGLLLSILLIGIISSLFGRMLFSVSRYGYYFISFIFIVAGCHLLGLLPEFWKSPAEKIMKFKGLAGALLIGLVFGIALGPCTFAYMAPVLAVGMGAAKSSLALSILIIIIYAIGHCLIIIMASTFTPMADRFTALNNSSFSIKSFKIGLAFLVLSAGCYLLHLAPPIF